ncbi:MAG: hypothetical protein ACF8CQ_18870 [Rhodopirellula sp. JB044]|uniref:hypothetical protein n=1 Tax=Rhodopirellula sp. JB044 TaxID=3342844 RepID=UPI00370A8E2D
MNTQRPTANTTQPRSTRAASFARICVAFLIVVAVSTANPNDVAAQDSQPSAMSKLNPMNWKVPSFRLPNFLVHNDDQERIVERKNGLVSDVKSTASRSWQRTKETFNPARLNPMNLFAGTSTDSTTEKKPGFFSSLLSPAPAEPEERVATVNDWLGQERPK